MPAATWRDRLAIEAGLKDEIDRFHSQIELRKSGKMDEKVFAETRLRRGVYGQRYDNGQRHDGIETRQLAFPCGELTKGPMTVWDAPGMVRIKIPYGGLTARQLEVIAELAEEYSDDILHVTTRQDVQLHFVHIEDTPDLMRRLGAVGITTREACGNSVRNVTGCPTAGVCRGEAFDTTPYTEAIFRFLLGHKDAQDFGRKFKIAVSGCAGEACALAMMHDAGLVAQLRDGQRGFAFYVGGGLGSVPEQAQQLSDFVPEEELLPILQCVCRIFGRLGEKKLRHKARLKFLIRDLGIEKFRELVAAERPTLPHDPAWTSWLTDKKKAAEEAILPPAALAADAGLSEAFLAWRATNVKPQRQDGYTVVKVTMPLGDFTSDQARALADIARRYVGETTGIRLTVEQNFVFRYIPEASLPGLHRELTAIGLGAQGADTIVDVTSCPGTDTCKLGIASSRGLAAALRQHLANRWMELDAVVRGLVIKVSGCFNSCGQHHVADIGFYGVTRKRHGKNVPHFQVFLGGSLLNNADSFGLAAAAVPSKRIPAVVDRYTDFYVKNRHKDERFLDFVKRIGKVEFRKMVEDLATVPAYEEAPELFTDWADPREYGIGDMGVGECAGEVVNTVDFDLAEAERILFEAQVAMDAGDGAKAAAGCDEAMYKAAKGLVYTRFIDITDDRAQIVAEFTARLVQPGLFADPFSGDKFAQYFLDAAAKPLDGSVTGDVHRRIEEIGLFIEACHSCAHRLAQPA